MRPSAERLRVYKHAIPVNASAPALRIVRDYSTPSWTGIEALDLLHQSQQDIPFIRKGAFDCLD
jgi:hypothetical protein